MRRHDEVLGSIGLPPTVMTLYLEKAEDSRQIAEGCAQVQQYAEQTAAGAAKETASKRTAAKELPKELLPRSCATDNSDRRTDRGTPPGEKPRM